MGKDAFSVGLCIAAAVVGLAVVDAWAQPAQPPSPTKPGAPAGGGAGGTGAGKAGAQNASIDDLVRRRLTQIQGILAEKGDAKAMLPEVTRLYDLYLAHGRFGDGALLAELVAARRVINHLASGKVENSAEHAKFLVANPRIAQTLALAVRPEDDVAGVYSALGAIRAAAPSAAVDKSGLDGLISAVCVVHDGPRAHPVLGTPIAPDAPGVFEFYRANKSLMLYDPSSLPVELLVYIVDAHAPVDELKWALKTFPRNANVGKLYGTIVYDTAAFKYGKQRKVLDAPGGYTLQNIKKLGGVCTEQGYYASEIAKAIGVPACLVSGEGSDVDHAWVGYVRSGGKNNWWDFSEGRYDEYQDTQGRVIDPQTLKPTSDAFVSLSAGMIGTPDAARKNAAALTDAAARLAAIEQSKEPYPARWPTGEEFGGVWTAPAPDSPVRAADAGAQLALLREALRSSPAYEPAWRAVVAMAEKGKLTTAQKSEWAEAVLKMAGRNRQDFALWVIAPMIRTVEPQAEQDRMWTWAFGQFAQRPDLASRVRFEQGRAWERSDAPGDNAKAYAAYQDVITRFANDGRAVLEALARSEELLVRAGRPEQALGLYEGAFRRVHKPRNMSPAFASSSNYYIVGFRYAELLELAGKSSESRRIKRTIGVVEDKERD